MRKNLIAVFCTLMMIAAAGCGQKEAAAPEGAEEAPPEETGNAVLDNLASEPDMP